MPRRKSTPEAPQVALPAMTPQQFVDKWRGVAGREMAGYAEHFIDICRMVGHPTPAEADPSQSFFCFQKSVKKDSGEQGFADVFYQRNFGWEYKGNHKDLEAAHRQLLQYRENLAKPPLLIVSDFEQIVIRTNFTNTVTKKYAVTLDDLLAPEPISGTPWSAIELLRQVFYASGELNPGLTPEDVTKEAAAKFANLADFLRGRKDAARRRKEDIPSDERIARFLTRLIFCMFASDVGLLPPGIVTQIVRANRAISPNLTAAFSSLFKVMQTGGLYGAEPIYYFNGGLFSDDEALSLWSNEVDELLEVDKLDWSNIEPSIFGTLFERVLDPNRRRQIGAHYTSRTDIETIVQPVLMAPLEREWSKIEAAVGGLNLFKTAPRVVERRAKGKHELQGFIDKLGALRVLDPACGSGNFLYVSLALLKGLEQRVIASGARWGVTGLTPKVHPRQLFGIETDHYAHELASMVVWIGYLQWKHKNGIPFETETPILEPLSNIRYMDAILDMSDAASPKEPEWPESDVAVGNPPFLGGKLLRRNLSDDYVDRLFHVWDGRVRREADLCCYWHEKARAAIEAGQLTRAGLLATQGIRGGANRDTLKRINESGEIFFAESDRPWVLDGASVHVAMVGFDDGTEKARLLNGARVTKINSNLTTETDLTTAERLNENRGISFMGDTKGGAFDIRPALAEELLGAPNPHGRPNSNVLKPWANGEDITGRRRGSYIVDFPPGTPEAEAALYEKPFEFLKEHVKPVRAHNKRGAYRDRWWMHVEPRPGMRAALSGLLRYLATPNLTKYRFFVWLSPDTLPDHQLIVFARQDDYFFGVLHSSAHEWWALAQGTQLEDRPRYTPTTCFETFPFPWPPGKEPKQSTKLKAIALAAAELDQYRNNWLDPASDSLDEEELKKRTLTNLYNQRPAWLDNAHEKLDDAVFAAYGWPANLTREEVLERLLALNLERAVKTQ